jgi:hypothetical protein
MGKNCSARGRGGGTRKPDAKRKRDRVQHYGKAQASRIWLERTKRIHHTYFQSFWPAALESVFSL